MGEGKTDYIKLENLDCVVENHHTYLRVVCLSDKKKTFIYPCWDRLDTVNKLKHWNTTYRLTFKELFDKIFKG